MLIVNPAPSCYLYQQGIVSYWLSLQGNEKTKGGIMKTTNYLSMLVLLAGLICLSVIHASATINQEGEDAFMVQFSIGWENSWRGQVGSAENPSSVQGSEGWDAAWLFVKYREGADPWQHAILRETGHLVPEGAILQPGLLDPEQEYHPANNPIVGYFLFREEKGSGSFSADGVKLNLGYEDNGLSSNTSFEVRLFAVEMEYIPGWGTSAQAPFYLMKHQVTQQEFVDFLNTLTLEEQMHHTHASPFSPEGFPVIQTGSLPCSDIQILFPAYEFESRQYPAEYMTGNPGIPCTFISKESALAFLGWAGQRSLSQQELEVAENWILFRNERNRRLNNDIILSGSTDDNGLAAGNRGARSATPAHDGNHHPISRAQLTPPKR
jgi:hypothetical protein